MGTGRANSYEKKLRTMPNTRGNKHMRRITKRLGEIIIVAKIRSYHPCCRPRRVLLPVDILFELV
jgi:hypothetical protein